MRSALIAVAVLAALVLAATLVGWLLPVSHRASREATITASPDEVYSVIADVSQYPAWRKKVRSVEVGISATGAPTFRESSSDGEILFVVDEAVPGRRFVTRIADPSLPFAGTWTFALSPEPGGTLLRITEDGQVFNPLFRFLSRFVFTHHATIDAYLADLVRRFPPRKKSFP